jgi:hypothetical protein
MLRRLWLYVVMAAVVVPAILVGQERLRIVPAAHEGDVVVSFELADAYTNDVRDAISSGLRMTFTYDVELRMVGSLWVDRTIASVIVGTSDQYDNLTRRHSLTRTVDGRVEGVTVTADESVVRQWLTTFTRLPLYKTSRLDLARDYYVRIRARSRPNGGSLLGWTNAITGSAKFTFVP